jgi:hypothetical protein
MAKQRPSSSSRVRFNAFRKKQELATKKYATDIIKERARRVISNMKDEKDARIRELTRQVRAREKMIEDMRKEHNRELERQKETYLQDRAHLFAKCRDQETTIHNLNQEVLKLRRELSCRQF